MNQATYLDRLFDDRVAQWKTGTDIDRDGQGDNLDAFVNPVVPRTVSFSIR